MPSIRMRLIDQIQFGPFSTKYHNSLVDPNFKTALSAFLDAELVSQLDEPTTDADGRLTATFDSDRFCGPTSLVRDIFTLELTFFGDDGTSDLKSDVQFYADAKTFSPRTGHDHYFYLWTPARKQRREHEMAMIQRFVDDIQRKRDIRHECPICNGQVSVVDDPTIFDVRCSNQRCFKYNYHKDQNGRLAHGHFFTQHPAKRA